jgi:hypothetical protein
MSVGLTRELLPAHLCMCDLQVASAAASLARPLAGDALAALARGGLACFRLAHAESAAQAALPPGLPAAARPNPRLPHDLRCRATNIMAFTHAGLTLPAAHLLAKRGLVGTLLQVTLPMLGDQVLTCAACRCVTSHGTEATAAASSSYVGGCQPQHELQLCS